MNRNKKKYPFPTGAILEINQMKMGQIDIVLISTYYNCIYKSYIVIYVYIDIRTNNVVDLQ